MMTNLLACERDLRTAATMTVTLMAPIVLLCVSQAAKCMCLPAYFQMIPVHQQVTGLERCAARSRVAIWMLELRSQARVSLHGLLKRWLAGVCNYVFSSMSRTVEV